MDAAAEESQVPGTASAVALRQDYPYRYFGAHAREGETAFRVYAPEATSVGLLREGNGWGARWEGLERDTEGVWTIVIPEDLAGQEYKYRVRNDRPYLKHAYEMARIDPFSRMLSVQAGSGGSRLYNSRVPAREPFPWTHKHLDRLPAPMSIYELHLGTFWNGGYRAIGEQLVRHLAYLGFTHVQIMPPFQTPIHESRGYLVGCPYALNERYGSVEDFQWLVNHLHAHGVGVIVDVPLGFGIKDWDCGLANYDGTDLYHHAGPRGWNNQWQTRIYNQTSPYVREYLTGICTYLHDELGVDGARIDAVAAQIFLDYDRGWWDWPRNDRNAVPAEDWEIFNRLGGDMHLADRGYWLSEATDFAALRFLRAFHERLARTAPGFFTIAEESRRVFPRLAVPVAEGGLGFTYAQHMGEMHRIRKYLSIPVEHRKIEHIEIILYRPHEERFVNPMNTHDECANGRVRLITELHNHIQLIGLAALCWFRPGAPMIFQGDECCEEGVFDVWHMFDWGKTGPGAAMHQQQMTNNIHDLNWLLTHEPALRRQEAWSMGRSGSNNERKYFSFARWATEIGWDSERAEDHAQDIVFVRNEAPNSPPCHAEVYVPAPGTYQVIYNSVDERYIGVQSYNRHDPYWRVETNGRLLYLQLLPYQNMALKLRS